MPGMTASTRTVVDRRIDALRVPNQALRYVPGGLSAIQAPAQGTSSRPQQVWVLRDGQPFAIMVVPGLNDDDFTEIVSGDIHTGDEVITSESSDQAKSQPGLPSPRF
jgi:HlyD family secretion protein